MIKNPLAILKNVPIFKGLSDDKLRAILHSKYCRQRAIQRHQVIWSVSDRAYSFYLILDGAVELYYVKRIDYINQREIHIKTIKKYHCFGMEDVLPDSNLIRQNYAKALTDTKVFELDRPILSKFFKLGEITPSVDMTDTEIMNFIRDHRFFEKMPQYQLSMYDSWSEIIDYAPGDIIFREGDAANCLYIVLGGIVEIFTIDDDGRLHVLNKISIGKYLGEQALLHGKTQMTRNAYARSDNAVKLLKINKDFFHQILKNDKKLLQSLLTIGKKQKIHRQKIISDN